jgi:hypothetical protein
LSRLGTADVAPDYGANGTCGAWNQAAAAAPAATVTLDFFAASVTTDEDSFAAAFLAVAAGAYVAVLPATLGGAE